MAYFPKYINAPCSVCIIFFVCMFSGITFGYWIPVVVYFPWKDIRFLSAFLSNLYFFVYSCELSVFPHLLWKVLFCCYTHVWTVVLVRLCGCSIWYYLEIKSHRKLHDPHPLTIFPPPTLQCSLNVTCLRDL